MLMDCDGDIVDVSLLFMMGAKRQPRMSLCNAADMCVWFRGVARMSL
jgi:hypothetical protein